MRRQASLLLKDKIAVIHGAGGAIGGTVARAFARKGAHVYLAGRTLARLEATAGDITHAGGVAYVAQVDAFDEQAIAGYLHEVVHTAGRVDISFNAVSLRALHGSPLLEMTHQDFLVTVVETMTTHFLTATAAARHMARQRAGVILAMTATAGRGYPNVGGSGVRVRPSRGSAGSSRRIV